MSDAFAVFQDFKSVKKKKTKPKTKNPKKPQTQTTIQSPFLTSWPLLSAVSATVRETDCQRMSSGAGEYVEVPGN